MSHPTPGRPIPANIWKSPFIIMIRSTKGHLFNGLIKQKSFGFMIHHSKAIPIDIKYGLDGLFLRSLEFLESFFTDVHTSRLIDFGASEVLDIKATSSSSDGDFILLPKLGFAWSAGPILDEITSTRPVGVAFVVLFSAKAGPKWLAEVVHAFFCSRLSRLEEIRICVTILRTYV